MPQQALIESMTNKYLLREVPPKHSLPLNPNLYQEGGGLLFIAIMARPGISFHASQLGRRAAKLSTSNYTAALEILQYLATTKPLGITLRKQTHLNLNAYADALYGGEGARSQAGILMTLGDQPIGWYNRRQDIVSLSLTEAEYITSCEGAQNAAWAQQFLAEIGTQVQPTLTIDSEGSFNLSQTSRCLRRTRNTEHRYHYIRYRQAG